MMACLDNNRVLKEGTVHRYENSVFRGEKKKYYYAELQQKTAPVKALECHLYSSSKDGKKGEFKDKIEMTSTNQVSISQVTMEKHKYDSYICITRANAPMSFLHFKKNSERDEWYNTIATALRSLNIPTIADDDSPQGRSRVFTEPEKDLRQVVERRRNSPTNNRGAISEPAGNAQGFKNVMDEMKTQLQQQHEVAEEVNTQAQEDFNPCCIRHHLVAFHADETNMVYHPETHYQNIHFVLSEEDWHREIQSKQDNIKLHNELYNDFHKLSVIQTPQPTSNEAPKWPAKQRPRQPSEPEATCPMKQSTIDDEAAVPLYENCSRAGPSSRHGRRSPVQNDDRDPTGGASSLHSLQHPSPPPPPLPSREAAISSHPRSSSMRDRPLPPLPPADDCEAKIIKQTFDRRPSNPYVASPSKNMKKLVRQPPLPMVTRDKLQRSQRCLREEMKQPNGITKDLPKTEVVGEKIALVECNDSLIVAGWEKQRPALTNSLHVGDKLTMINQQMLNSARFAQETITMTGREKVTLVLQRIPYGDLISIRKEHPGQSLGIEVNGNEVTSIYPNGLAALQGNLRQQTAGITGLSNWAITEINTRPVAFNSTTEQVQEMLRNAGDDILLVLHPLDFIQVLREALDKTGDRYN